MYTYYSIEWKAHLPAIIINNIFAQFFTQLAQYAIFVEKFALITMLKVLGNSLSHITWELTICHIFFDLFDLFDDWWMAQHLRSDKMERNKNRKKNRRKTMLKTDAQRKLVDNLYCMLTSMDDANAMSYSLLFV